MPSISAIVTIVSTLFVIRFTPRPKCFDFLVINYTVPSALSCRAFDESIFHAIARLLTKPLQSVRSFAPSTSTLVPHYPSGRRIQTQILFCRDDTERICMAHAPAPTLNADNSIAFVQNAKLDGIDDAPLQAAINVFLPRCAIEVRFSLIEQEGVHATVEVRILRAKSRSASWPELLLECMRIDTYAGSTGIAGDHDDWANRAVL